MDIIIFILTSVGIGMFFSIPGIAFGSYLEKRQIASNRVRDVVLFSVFFVFVKRIWYPQVPYFWLAIILILGTTAGLYKMEIYWAMKKNKDER